MVISVENREFSATSPYMYLAPPLTEFPLELGIGAWSQQN